MLGRIWGRFATCLSLLFNLALVLYLLLQTCRAPDNVMVPKTVRVMLNPSPAQSQLTPPSSFLSLSVLDSIAAIRREQQQEV
jgi:hypothetical protein